jgi:hypothetical protein
MKALKTIVVVLAIFYLGVYLGKKDLQSQQEELAKYLIDNSPKPEGNIIDISEFIIFGESQL